MHPTSDWLTAWARFRPDAPAVLDTATGRSWTYAALQYDALRWAADLVEAGVGPGDRVAVLALNRGETLALLFAVAELGAVLFPMNWRLSRAELAWQLEHSAPKLMFADAEHTARAGEFDVPLRSLDDGPRAASPGPRGPGSDLSQPWLLMYTSGSTGRPKGALITHGQVHWNAVNTTLACDLDPGCSTLTFAPLFHTGGMNCLTTPMLHRGGAVVLTPRLDAAEALALIQEHGITHLMGVPTIYQLLADHPCFADADLSSVRDAICGGAALPAALLRRYLDRGLPLRQGFGLTEVGPNCFSMPHDAVRPVMVDADGGRGAPGCVGRPIHHVSARVVRPDGSTCAVDEPGELVLSGPAVFGGYLDDPDATAAAMQDGGFRTGDVLSVDADGFFHVRGRLKEMFISGGENVYPAEIEAALHGCAGVGLAAVVGVPDARWGEVGCAFVEAAGELDLDALRAELADRLARFKLPKTILRLDHLPRTGSGKIDKPALAALAASNPSLQKPAAPPRR